MMRDALGSMLLTFVFLVTIWLAVLSRNHEQHRESDAIAGTDMFWELHDRRFPEHYLPDGRVTCSEEQAAKELRKADLVIEP